MDADKTSAYNIQARLFSNPHLPPGSLGWSLIVEILDYLGTCFAGEPGRFLRDRMEKHNPHFISRKVSGFVLWTSWEQVLVQQ
ncbi:unnamed protein product [Dovyalis caffra]|uniref:Uncharacterized protein n=1 Tax=Dovyalis caffra TaxID=77055 RepID=A0AAV1RZ43_9ROSI|nr:unnamed protein product [Dovyalis caffra]